MRSLRCASCGCFAKLGFSGYYRFSVAKGIFRIVGGISSVIPQTYCWTNHQWSC